MNFRLTILFFFFTPLIFGQINLVPNYSFEILDTCQFQYGQVYLANPWFQPNYPQSDSTSCSTDIWNSCYGNFGLGTPSNDAGFQYPRTGNGYAGFATMLWSNDSIDREYLEVELLDSVCIHKNYCVSFYVSFASLLNSHIPTSAIGVYLSNDSLTYYSNEYTTIHVTPQITNPYENIILDTTNWVEISGIYTASGGEKFITIGNFWDPPYINDTCIGSPCAGSYYYIDDISVILCDTIVGLNETITNYNLVNVFPNPTSNELTVDITSPDKCFFGLFDLLGTKRLSARLDSSSKTVDLTGVDSGVYVFTIVDGNGDIIKTDKLIIIK